MHGLPGVEFIPVNKKPGWQSFLDLKQQLNGRNFDVLLLMQISLRANLLSTLVKSPSRIGFDRNRTKDLHGLFINQRIAEVANQHVIDGFFEFLKILGIQQRVLDWSLPIPQEAHEFAELNLPADKPIMIISPCSSHTQRNWLAEHYATVADYAIKRHGMNVVLCGGPSQLELEYGHVITARMKNPITNLIGKDSLKRLAALLMRADILLSPDSGPAHIATCTGTRVIGLYAATNMQRSGPYSSREWCVDKYQEAAIKFRHKPAVQLKWGTKIEQPGVMSLIQPEDVIRKIDAMMSESNT